MEGLFSSLQTGNSYRDRGIGEAEATTMNTIFTLPKRAAVLILTIAALTAACKDPQKAAHFEAICSTGHFLNLKDKAEACAEACANGSTKSCNQ